MKDDQHQVKEAFMDLLNHTCGTWEREWDSLHISSRAVFKGYNSRTVPAYERAIAFALSKGWVTSEDVVG